MPVYIKDRGFNSFASNMIKLSVNETKWSSLLARTRTLILYISIWIFDFGPEKLLGLSRNGTQATKINTTDYQYWHLFPLAHKNKRRHWHFGPGYTEFKATLELTVLLQCNYSTLIRAFKKYIQSHCSKCDAHVTHNHLSFFIQIYNILLQDQNTTNYHCYSVKWQQLLLFHALFCKDKGTLNSVITKSCFFPNPSPRLWNTWSQIDGLPRLSFQFALLRLWAKARIWH